MLPYLLSATTLKSLFHIFWRPYLHNYEDINSKTTLQARLDIISKSKKPSVRVIDFVDNCGKHKVVTTANLLVGINTPFLTDFDDKNAGDILREVNDILIDIEKDEKDKTLSGDQKKDLISKLGNAQSIREMKLIVQLKGSIKIDLPTIIMM